MSRACGRCGRSLEVRARDGVDRISGPGDERWVCPDCDEPDVPDADDVRVTVGEADDWTLAVTGEGDVLASKTIPYDGVRYYSTEQRPNRAIKASEFKLTQAEVLDHYVDVTETTTDRDVLVGRIDGALRVLREVYGDE